MTEEEKEAHLKIAGDTKTSDGLLAVTLAAQLDIAVQLTRIADIFDYHHIRVDTQP